MFYAAGVIVASDRFLDSVECCSLIRFLTCDFYPNQLHRLHVTVRENQSNPPHLNKATFLHPPAPSHHRLLLPKHQNASFYKLMTPKKRPRSTGPNPPSVAPVPKSQKPPGELLSSEEKRANHIASVRPRLAP